jgi:hypothetical protein
MLISELGYIEENGLVLCNRWDTAKNSHELLYLDKAKKLGAFGVFFRRFFKEGEDNSFPFKSEPTVCFFNSNEIQVGSRDHFNIHSALWSEGLIDIYIFFDDFKIDIFNSKKPAKKIDQDKLTLESPEIKLASGAINELDKSRYSAHLFGTGTFWELTQNQKYIDLNKSPYYHLVGYLMEVRKEFKKSFANEVQECIDRILILSILVKFLEEKKDPKTERSTLVEIYKYHNVNDYEDAIRKGLFIEILEYLGQEFNGKIFDQFSDLEKITIKSCDLLPLADFLSAKIDVASKQMFIWEQYNFDRLPAEVISAIYENFIQAEAEAFGTGREKGVIYTPIHMVNFLVDEAMPLDQPDQEFVINGRYKILDPTCGSGVFLVAAFKRLIQWWILENYKKTGKIQYPNKEIAQNILESNIHGVDINKTAVMVSIFGLTTALIDILSPKEVWSQLKFSDLSKSNIIVGQSPSGFFQWALNAKQNSEQFSLVIGNPPFNPENKSSKNKVLDPEIIKKLELMHYPLPRDNFALHFFETSMVLGKKVCMIIPSSILLYDKASIGYRKNLFSNYDIDKIFDFTHLRRILFTSADTPVLALIAVNKTSKKKAIQHIVLKRTISSENKTRFEIDLYDKHLVNWEWVMDPNKYFIWKTNLLGGGRLFHLIYRLSQLRNLNEFLRSKESEGWVNLRGFEGGIKYSKKYSNQITEIDDDGIPNIKVGVELFSGNFKDEKIYQPPVLIFDQVLGIKNIPFYLVSTKDKYSNIGHLYYSRDFVGIKAPEHDEGTLVDIAKLFKENYGDQLSFQFFVLCIGSSSLILTETDVNKGELFCVPFPENLENLNLTDEEIMIQSDVLKYFRNLGKSISNGGEELFKAASKSELQIFGKILCTQLNDIYELESNVWQLGEINHFPNFIMLQLGFGQRGILNEKFEKTEEETLISKILNSEFGNSGSKLTRITRIYRHENGFDFIYLIKPNAKKYWLRSIALRDADEIFKDFLNKGY